MSKSKAQRQGEKARRSTQETAKPLARAKQAGPQTAQLAREVGRSIAAQGSDSPRAARIARALQRSVGANQAARLTQPEAKPQRLSVVPSGDASEVEAQQVARNVAAGKSAGPIQKMSAGAEPAARDCDKAAKAARACDQKAAKADERLSRKVDDDAARAGDEQANRSSAALDTEGAAIEMEASTGKPLEPGLRATLESRLKADLGHVRVHHDAAADRAAAALQARAFAQGSAIYLRQSESPADLELMAHEVTHVIQQQGGTRAQRLAAGESLARPAPAAAHRMSDDAPAARVSEPIPPVARATAPAPPAATPAAAAAPEGDLAPGVLELKGQAALTPTPEMIEYISKKPNQRGKVSMQFGDLAAGTANVRVQGSGSKAQLKLADTAELPFKKDLFAGTPLPENIRPALKVTEGKKGITGWVGMANSKVDNILVAAKENAAILGLGGLDLVGKTATNELAGGQLTLALNNFGVKVGDAFDGTVNLTSVDGGAAKFDGSAVIRAKGLEDATLTFERSPEGVISGNVNAKLSLPKNITGAVDVTYADEKITGVGKASYQGEKLSGNITLHVMDAAEARLLKEQKSAPEGKGGEAAPKAEGKKAEGGKGGGGKKKSTEYAVFGDGDLDFHFNDWLNGTAHVIVDSDGYVTVIGAIEPQKEFCLFEQRDFVQPLPKLEARAAYGLPVVGNIFVFASVGLDMFAKIGPAKLYKIGVEGTYSTDPKIANDFRIHASLNLSAAAGVRLRGEAGVGLEILGHDIKAGAGVTGIAGVRGYAEATPIIGYHEPKGEDKHGDFFINGEVEIAGQAFVGLSGDLFVEVDSPWWSPLPDMRETWPLGGKEWPLGNPIGVKANVAYTVGSNELPSVEFQPASFDANKFFTDLYQDKVPAAKKPADSPGTWKEKNSPDAAPPKPAAGTAKPGPLADAPAPKPKVQRGGKKSKKEKPVDPKAPTADGKKVEDAAKDKDKKKKKPAEGEDKDREKKLADGLAALDAVTKGYEAKGATRKEMQAAVKSTRRKFKVFKSIELKDAGDRWNYLYEASPAVEKAGPKKSKEDDDKECCKKKDSDKDAPAKHPSECQCETCCADKGFYKVERAIGTWTDYVLTKCNGSMPDVQNPHGHHIVMKGDRFSENAKARNILCKYGINPFLDCRNLVIARNYCHSSGYAAECLRQLKAADNPQATAGSIASTLQSLAAWHAACGTPGEVDEKTDEA